MTVIGDVRLPTPDVPDNVTIDALDWAHEIVNPRQGSVISVTFVRNLLIKFYDAGKEALNDEASKA